ncbi:hypothetical protein H7U37_07715 [Pseudoflavonifractor phocaeensis]|uniref:hypothetical protein n=1 Tax=Pseudoflavonifractor phocaeensis TaxID=1870988 RepID=UPI001956F0CB|nr:hypothetical protein [Pseudoflavonifractor phocaeensis]MBM6869494.1 hypothetical protein [Pseudoflavonifractor phocaeensis]MBM6938411.1 hypothetical protein [Pseudoflavonifractor phocaeensis]
MVTIVWLILSLAGVCGFSWWPVLIESILYMIVGSVSSSDGGRGGAILGVVMAGFAPFAAYKLFCGLTLSPWWMLAAPVWNFVALVVPGGYTISGILLERYGFMTLPTWVLVVSVVLDVLFLIGIILMLVEGRQDAKSARKSGRY